MTELTPKKVRTSTLTEFKVQSKRFACLTSYDSMTSRIFDEAGIEVILVGDSAADNFLGYSSTLPVTIDEMITFGRAVAGSVSRSLVVVDLPFGSYEEGPEQALKTAVRVMKETGASAVKLEGGAIRAETIAKLHQAGIPVMAHIGFTPQSVHALGGFKVQGRGDGAAQLEEDALAVQNAGAFAVVLELVPAELATEITNKLHIPTIGIGAGSGTDGQILVWTDFAGLSEKQRKFVRKYAELREELFKAAKAYPADILSGNFPSATEQFEN